MTRATTFPMVLLLGAAACAPGDSASADPELAHLTGTLEADGSSTVSPITEAMAEEFGRATGGAVRVTVGVSGTGGGFKRFCAGQTELSNASRPIKDEEQELCAANGVQYLEIPVATDGLAVAVHPENDAVECLTVEELRKLWEPGSTIGTWAELRPGLPAEQIKLYGPGTNSGTFDYFTEAIMGEEDASRGDYSASEDDNVLVQGVAGDRWALGYFGYAYYQENQERLKALAVDGGSGCVPPTAATVASGQYAPLSRPLLVYVNREALGRPEVAAFLEFYLENAGELVPVIGYVPRRPAEYQQELQKLGGDGARQQQ